MEAKLKEKTKSRKRKSIESVSLDQFSPTEQAKIILAADKTEKPIPIFMEDCIRQHIAGAIQIQFQERSLPDET